MAEYAIGPNGLQFQDTPKCTDNLIGMDKVHPAVVLKDRLTEQYFRGISRTRYEDIGVDEHMPMRESTSQRTDGVDDFRIAVTMPPGISNDMSGTFNPNPVTAPFTYTRSILNACGIAEEKGLGARGNTNAEGCNPVIDGPLPIVGHESFGREPRALRAPIPPICTQDFANKHSGTFAETFSQVLQTTIDANLYRWQILQFLWIHSKTRYTAVPYQIPAGNGRAKIPAKPELFNPFSFDRVPEHWATADWIASMIRYSEIPQRQNVKVEVPVSILIKYKEDYFDKLGLSALTGPTQWTRDVNGYQANIINEDLVYIDRVTGRRIRFVGTTNPVYVEVVETGPDSGKWYFQEKFTLRDSETANQIMPRENPLWGRACSCQGRTLAAIVTVSADGEKPFYKEPLPGNNPDARIKEIISRYGGGEVNATLRDLYPSSLEIRILTGIDAQVHLIEPLNRRYREAGWNCDKFSNLENTYIGGYLKIGSVFVENQPRQLVQFLLKVPPEDSICTEISTVCADEGPVPEGIDLAHGETREEFAPLNIPSPPEPEPPSAGLIRPLTGKLNVLAPCEGSKDVTLYFEREGGTSGTLALAIAATPSPHASGVPVEVEFEDGEGGTKAVTFSVDAWPCDGEGSTETFTIEYGPENLAEDPAPFTSTTVCISCNPNCPSGDCPTLGENCSSCG